MPIQFDHVYLSAAGLYLPGPAIDNEEMDAFIAPINKISKRIKSRILAENGIKIRHYAIDAEGKTRQNHAQIAAAAVHHCLDLAQASIEKVSLLAVGSSGGDALMPGFANMIQGELGAPPHANCFLPRRMRSGG
jgi:3-oxoacyl-[acyl-carrier-protein] synthase-3